MPYLQDMNYRKAIVTLIGSFNVNVFVLKDHHQFFDQKKNHAFGETIFIFLNNVGNFIFQCNCFLKIIFSKHS